MSGVFDILWHGNTTFSRLFGVEKEVAGPEYEAAGSLEGLLHGCHTAPRTAIPGLASGSGRTHCSQQEPWPPKPTNGPCLTTVAFFEACILRIMLGFY